MVKMHRIGLVLSAAPGYSETFFRNKIKGLQENGAAVMLFVGGAKQRQQDMPCAVFYAPDYGSSVLTSFLNGILQVIMAVFVNPKRSARLYFLERKDGRSFIASVKTLLANQHILSQELDFLHFGFGTMAIGRENVAKAMGAKMAASFRGFDIGIYPLRNPGCYKLLFDKADKIHVISNDLEQLLYQNGLDRQRANVVKITPAIDSRFFTPVIAAEESEKIVQFITLARLNWKKGLEYTLEALALLKQKGIAFHYTIVGDGPEKERLIFAAYQLGLLENVTFTGKKSHGEVKLLLEKATVYLQYSLQEGFCNAVLEAQAMGLLCVVSNAEGLSENVLDNETGWVVAKRNPVALAKKMQEVIALEATEKEKIRLKAIERVRNQFNLEKQQQEFLEFYDIKNKK